jgi:hypothetical protein
MKRQLTLCLAGLALFGFLSSAQGALVPGTYKLTANKIEDGSWTEYFAGGVEGAPGSVLIANSSPAQWTLVAGLQSVTNVGVPSGWDYSSQYNVIFQFTGPGPWGDAFSLSGVPATNLSRRASYPSGNLAFKFSTSGSVGTVPVEIIAEFDSIDGPYGSYTRGTSSHTGTGFEEITLRVIPIPGAALLLASGLIGLVGLRRYRRK